MTASAKVFKSGDQLSERSLLTWRMLQSAVWLMGAAILVCLLFFPSLGILLFWNILIPVAPALLVVATGVWRNVCPLATTTLLPRHLGLSKKKRLSVTQSGMLNFTAVLLLYIIVPLRHAVFNSDGPATALLILSLATAGIIMGFFYEWKSAWCSGLCPVHPVERLYGGNTLLSLPNAHCSQCQNCVIPCPDSTPNIHPGTTVKTNGHKIAALLITGGLPGFIWGWFHVADEAMPGNIHTLVNVYKMPVLAGMVTLAVYFLLQQRGAASFQRLIDNIFAASAVSCYYWYRLPALFGFGNFADDGLLISLRGIVPSWTLSVVTIITTLFFFYWLVIRKPNGDSWVLRPPYAGKETAA